MYTLPEEGFLRLRQIIGDKKNPAIIPIIPISRSNFLAGVKEGRFPKPIKLGLRIIVWKVSDIRKLIEGS